MTEINNSNSNNKNVLGNKYKILINKNNEKPKLDIIDSIDNRKLSINRKIVNNYLTTTQKKKTYQGKFTDYESSSLNTCNNINNNTKNNGKYNDVISQKIEVLNIYNTIQNNKNNPIKFKLDKKNMIRKTKINSMQINNKNEFLSSFNLTKEKNQGTNGTNIELDIINIDDNIINYHKKKSIKKYLNNKTQTNSEAELIKENIIFNTFTSKSLKKDKIKNINDKKIDNNNFININNNDMKKINVKEMKEKYHKLLRGKKFTHGSYDTANRLHLLRKFRVLNNPLVNLGNISNNIINNTINNTINSNKFKRSPLTKKNILSPMEKNRYILNNYNKTPFKNKTNKSNKNNIPENNNINNNNDILVNKYHYITNKKINKLLDINNKKMKYVKK